MGTRGLTGFIIDGVEKLSYQQFDSYPSGVGISVLSWARTVMDWDEVKNKARSLVLVDESETPTAEQRALLDPSLTDSGVSNGVDWYSVLREAQGDPAKLLDAKFILDSKRFVSDGLFNEWTYVIDLDEMKLEVYTGFKGRGESVGRFADRQERGSDYDPVSLVATFDLLALPTDEEMIAIESGDEEE